MQTIVVGGSGMIGSAIQRQLIKQEKTENCTFSYYTNKSQILRGLESLHLDLFDEDSIRQLEGFHNAIYLAGNTDHALASKDPAKDVQLNVEAFLNFMKFFKGTLVLFSSQAVYYGYEGSVKEDAVQKPTIPYGISRHGAEMYAEYFKHVGKLRSLVILRPTYVFGQGEEKRRLIPRCAQAAITGSTVKVFGKGQSFLNPLPVEFIAQVTVKFSEVVANKECATAVNLNCTEPMTVIEIVQTLQKVKSFKCVVEDGGEEWPAKHYGDSTRLLGLLKEWNMKMPDVTNELKRYFMELVGEKK
jgi:nucleoside-diphosphate-sugar epimerase